MICPFQFPCRTTTDQILILPTVQSQALRPTNTRTNSAAVRRTSESTSLDDIEPEVSKGRSQSSQVTKKKEEPLITSKTGVSDELKSEIKTVRNVIVFLLSNLYILLCARKSTVLIII